ncbi:MAG: hypothetical protein ACRCTZ_08275 [Sarcina sp.]
MPIIETIKLGFDESLLGLSKIYFKFGKIHECSMILGGDDLRNFIKKLKETDNVNNFEDLFKVATSVLERNQKISEISNNCTSDRELISFMSFNKAMKDLEDYIPKENKNIGKLTLDAYNFEGKAMLKVIESAY